MGAKAIKIVLFLPAVVARMTAAWFARLLPKDRVSLREARRLERARRKQIRRELQGLPPTQGPQRHAA